MDFRHGGLTVRANVGVEWGQALQGRKRALKGYRPVRRLIQVSFDFPNEKNDVF